MLTPVALSIAGSDPSGGAGIQADLKTFHQFGVYGEGVITLITVQNSLGVQQVHVLDVDLIEAQVHAVISDIRPRAAKTGALGNQGVADAIARLAGDFDFPLVVDPVMNATRYMAARGAAPHSPDRAEHGTAQHSHDRHIHAPLGDVDSIRPLLRRAHLVTPNLNEASAICGFPVTDLESMRRAAKVIADMGATNILLKGGHLRGEAVDLLFTCHGQFHEFAAPRIQTAHTHGTGCALSAAVTAELAKGTALVEAVGLAKAYVTEAIRSNPGLGCGSGPLNFFAR